MEVNKRIKKKKLKQFYGQEGFVYCDKCGRITEYYREEDEGDLCPSCFADLVGLSSEEVWRCIG